MWRNPLAVLVFALSILGVALLVAAFAENNAFGLDYRIFRYAVRLPIEQLYAARPTAAFAYPPTAIALFEPLGFLPITIGFCLWTALSVGLFLYATNGVDRRVVLLAALSPVFVKCLLIGQSPLLLGSLVLLGCIRGGWLGGLLLGVVLAVKPQLALMAPVVLLARKDALGLVGLCAGVALMLAVELALYGAQPWFAWVEAVPRFRQLLADEGLLWVMVNPSGVAQFFGLPSLPFLLAGVALGVAAVIRSKEGDGIELAALVTVASVISVPYAVHYDLIAALPFAASIILRGRIDVWAIAAALLMTMAFMAAGLILFAIAWLRLDDFKRLQ